MSSLTNSDIMLGGSTENIEEGIPEFMVRKPNMAKVRGEGETID